MDGFWKWAMEAPYLAFILCWVALWAVALLGQAFFKIFHRTQPPKITIRITGSGAVRLTETERQGVGQATVRLLANLTRDEDGNRPTALERILGDND